MQDRSQEAHPARVVALVGETPVPGLGEGELCAEGVRVVRVGGAYEAAAELLAAPAAALVVDLRLLLPRHVRLLEVARGLEAAILAVGVVPAGLDAETLRGVTFLSPGELPEAMGRAAELRERAGVALRPAGERPATHAAPEPAEAGQFRPEPAESQPAEAPNPGPDGDPPRPGNVLTPEEISALLENEH